MAVREKCVPLRIESRKSHTLGIFVNDCFKKLLHKFRKNRQSRRYFANCCNAGVYNILQALKVCPVGTTKKGKPLRLTLDILIKI